TGGEYSGLACIFDATTGAFVTKLNNPHSSERDLFGGSVSISGNMAVVGAHYDNPGGAHAAGTAYVFGATTGVLAATLNKPSPTFGDEFGRSVAISGKVVVSGAAVIDPSVVSGAGSAYTFFCPAPDALIVSHSIPSQIASDHDVPVQITVRNTGT